MFDLMWDGYRQPQRRCRRFRLGPQRTRTRRVEGGQNELLCAANHWPSVVIYLTLSFIHNPWLQVLRASPAYAVARSLELWRQQEEDRACTRLQEKESYLAAPKSIFGLHP